MQMNASMTQFAKAVDFSATDKNMAGALLHFVHGIRKHRTSCVTLKQIQAWFSATPPAFVAAKVDELVADGRLLILRTGLRKRCAYLYGITNQGACCLHTRSWHDTEWGHRQYMPGPDD